MQTFYLVSINQCMHFHMLWYQGDSVTILLHQSISKHANTLLKIVPKLFCSIIFYLLSLFQWCIHDHSNQCRISKPFGCGALDDCQTSIGLNGWALVWKVLCPISESSRKIYFFKVIAGTYGTFHFKNCKENTREDYCFFWNVLLILIDMDRATYVCNWTGELILKVEWH